MIKNSLIVFFGALTAMFYMENQVLFEENSKLVESKFVVENVEVSSEFSPFVSNYLQTYLINHKVNKSNPFFQNRFDSIKISFKDLENLSNNQNQISCIRENQKVSFFMKVSRSNWNSLNQNFKQNFINQMIDNCVLSTTTYSNSKVVSI